jgi:hypothetical protein
MGGGGSWDAIERGEWNPDVRAELLVAAVFGAAIHRTMIERQPISPEWTADLVALVRYGVAGPAAGGDAVDPAARSSR